MICSHCDHGQLYCGEDCSGKARQRSTREAGARYQKTESGRANHAARQQRYLEKMTHHPSANQPSRLILQTVAQSPSPDLRAVSDALSPLAVDSQAPAELALSALHQQGADEELGCLPSLLPDSSLHQHRSAPCSEGPSPSADANARELFEEAVSTPAQTTQPSLAGKDKEPVAHVMPSYRCHFCGCRSSGYVRLGFCRTLPRKRPGGSPQPRSVWGEA